MSTKTEMKAIKNADHETDSHEQNTNLQDENNKTDYDSAWKEVIEKLFEPFTEFFFPDIHQDIDFSKGVEILDSQLRRALN